MKDRLSEILEVAIHAPSGENVQPWKFKIREDAISVFNIPERDQSPYNFKQHGSFVSHGALIENIVIASSKFGLEPNISLFPEEGNENLVAIISFQEISPKEDPLFQFILKRSTNRKAYKKENLLPEHKQAILSTNNSLDEGKLELTERNEDIQNLSLVGSMNERLVLENEVLHNFLFTHITWTKKENEEKKMGFYIKTLELPGPGMLMFKLFSKWERLKRFQGLKVSQSVWKQNGKVYAASSAFGIIKMTGNSNADYVKAGRLTQRVWLNATKMGLSIQPLTGTIFFMQRILGGSKDPFTDEQIKLVQDSYMEVEKVFDLKGEVIPMMFRIGYSNPPSAKALKLKPEIISE